MSKQQRYTMNCFPFLFKRRSESVESVVGGGLKQGDDHIVKTYTYKQLKTATNDFAQSNKLGEGGFGCVYKGKLKDGTMIAAKLLSSESKQGACEFLNELDVISNVAHENLVRLYGCCVEDGERILVYEYAENNSIAHALVGSAGLQSNRDTGLMDWGKRVQICVGVARGLEFLHETVRPHIVHRDIKASNILLDKHLNPKISDFGLARLIPPDMTHVSTRVAGTIGYLAPEYAIRGQLTRRADIYSFGVLLLEIVTGRCNTNMVLSTVDEFLLERSADITHGLLLMQTWMLYECGNLSAIVDSLEGEINAEEACRFLKIGLLCTQDAPKQRPLMSAVVKMLTGGKPVHMENITKPGLISDFMELKIRNLKKDNIKSSCTYSSPSVQTSNPSFG